MDNKSYDECRPCEQIFVSERLFKSLPCGTIEYNESIKVVELEFGLCLLLA